MLIVCEFTFPSRYTKLEQDILENIDPVASEICEEPERDVAEVNRLVMKMGGTL